MNILNILFRNLTKPSRSQTPENKVAFPHDFRGELLHDPLQCTLCGSCVYVCSPAAITIERGESRGTWAYDGGRCTFCGRCVEYCPTEALSFANHSAPIVASRTSEITHNEIEYQRCPRCGEMMIPLPVTTIQHLYHLEADRQPTVKIYELCERCRNRIHSQALKSSISGTKNER